MTDLQSFTLMMASTQVVETSVNTNNSPSQDYTTSPDDHSNHNKILGNLGITSKWSPSHLDFKVFFISVEPLGPTGKLYGARLHLWESKVAKIALAGARIHFQNGHTQRDDFARGLKSFSSQYKLSASQQSLNHLSPLVSFR